MFRNLNSTKRSKKMKRHMSRVRNRFLDRLVHFLNAFVRFVLFNWFYIVQCFFPLLGSLLRMVVQVGSRFFPDFQISFKFLFYKSSLSKYSFPPPPTYFSPPTTYLPTFLTLHSMLTWIIKFLNSFRKFIKFLKSFF